MYLSKSRKSNFTITFLGRPLPVTMYGLFSLNALHWFNQEYFTIPHHMCVRVCGLDVYFGGAAHSECKDFNLTHSSCAYSVDFAVSYAIRKRLTSFSSTVMKEAKRRPMHTFIYSSLTCFEYTRLLPNFFSFCC